MKMFKRVVSLAMVSALAITSLTACGGGSSEEAASSDTFKIGGIGPTTGDAAAYGAAVQNGIQLAVDEINEPAVSTASRLSLSLRMTSLTLRNLSMRTTH